jgi:N-acetylglucosaminyldiphosphoundecaprenol N-acetyl-beta-D-mannosaminyltransferase
MKKFNQESKKNGPKVGQIMGIKLNSTTTSSVLTGAEDFISCSHKFYIVTPNPELILMAQKVPNLKNALNAADFSIPDGVGLKFANPKLNIIKGRELFMDLVKLAAKKNWKVFLLGGLDNEAELAAKKLMIHDSKFQIQFSKGPTLDKDAKPATSADDNSEKEAVNQINTFKPQLLFVAFGNPKQEIWIHQNLSKLNVGGAMAVGGSFRYVAGMSKLPPRWMASCGLEWLWRLVTEPKRIGRIFRAVIVFPINYLLYKVSH